MSERKRRKWTAAEKLRIVLTCMQLGVEVSEVCRREGINPTQFYSWRKKLMGSACIFVRTFHCPSSKNGGFQIDSQAVLSEADRINVFVSTDQENHIRVVHHVVVLLIIVGDPDTSGPRPVLPMISTEAAMNELLLFHC